MDKKILKNKLIAKIHIGKKELKLNEDDYRILLKCATDGTKESAGKMNISELKEVLSAMKEMGFYYKNNKATQSSKYFSVLKDDIKYLSERQVKYIKGLWWQNANNPCEESLKTLINKLTGKSSLGECGQKEANILITAISQMTRRQNG